ncbi:MAG: VOC family protein [Methylophagaceae bacterium]
MKRPQATAGMRHVAIFVSDLESCEKFYVDLLGMKVEWRPDADNIYLTSGNDNLALHRANTDFDTSGAQKLDHIGFIIKTPEQVDQWFEFLQFNDVAIRQPPRTHRDGARSFYCYDPANTVVQIIYHPPIS